NSPVSRKRRSALAVGPAPPVPGTRVQRGRARARGPKPTAYSIMLYPHATMRTSPLPLSCLAWSMSATAVGITRTRSMTMAYLEVTLKVQESDRPAAAEVYTTYRQPFLDSIAGATSKELLVRDEDVQVLHGFESTDAAVAYLSSELFTKDVVGGLSPLLEAEPEVRVYDAA